VIYKYKIHIRRVEQRTKSRHVIRVSSPFELVYSNVWGPANFASNDIHYFVTFVDDHSHTTWLFLMNNRSELFSIFQLFCKEIKTQFAQNIRTLQSDNAKEYLSHPFTTFLVEKGIVHQTSCA
jgi:transposase InsO family protein